MQANGQIKGMSARTKLLYGVPTAVLVVVLVWLRAGSTWADGEPNIIVAPSTAYMDSVVQVPLVFAGGGNTISALAFTLEYDENYLELATAADVVFFLPSQFTKLAFTQQGESGRVNLIIYTLARIGIPDMTVAAIPFTAKCPAGSGTEVQTTVSFAATPEVGFGALDGYEVDGRALDGVVTIHCQPAPTPTYTVTAPPSATVTPTPTATRTPTPIPTVTNTPLPPPTATATPTNWPPQAQDDSVALDEDQSALIDVLKNDTDRDGDNIRLMQLQPPAHGVAAIEQNQIRYSPAANYHGPDAIGYRVGDGQGAEAGATVHVTVRPVNDAPDTAPDVASTSKNRSVGIAVLANDQDADGDVLHILRVSAPEHGSVSLQPDETVLYRPDNGYFGSDVFTYVVSDGIEERSETVDVTVSAAEAEFRLWTEPSPDTPIKTGQIVRAYMEFRNTGTIPLTDVVLQVELPVQAEILSSALSLNAEADAQNVVLGATAGASMNWTVARLEVGQFVSAVIRLRIDAGQGDAPAVAAEWTAKQLSVPAEETVTYPMEQTDPLSVHAFREENGIRLTWQGPVPLASHTFSVWCSQAPRWRGATRLSEVTARDSGDVQEDIASYEILLDVPQLDVAEYIWIEEVGSTEGTVVHGPIALANLERKSDLLYLPAIHR